MPASAAFEGHAGPERQPDPGGARRRPGPCSPGGQVASAHSVPAAVPQPAWTPGDHRPFAPEEPDPQGYSQGPATAGSAWPPPRSPAPKPTHRPLWCGFCPAPARSRAAWLAAVNSSGQLVPDQRYAVDAVPGGLRFSAMPLAPPSTWGAPRRWWTPRCTAIPTITQTTTSRSPSTSLTSCMNNRCGREA